MALLPLPGAPNLARRCAPAARAFIGVGIMSCMINLRT